jgi:uncharacterized membrane protein SpoIIM required for sporulation
MNTPDRDRFVEDRRARWSRLEALVSPSPSSAAEWSELAAGYRGLCADIARARALGVPRDVAEFLDELAGRAHNQLYGVRPTGFGRSLFRDALHEFPRELRANWGFFVLAVALFFGPFLFGVFATQVDADFAGRVLSPDQLRDMEAAYSGQIARTTSQDAGMAGFYVWNNVGIAFRAFALGVLYGFGTIFYLIYNGLVIGTVFGYLGSVGLAGNLLEFTSGHSAWELTGICVSGAAGLRMGWALVATGGRTRTQSLRDAGPALYRLVLGTTVMLLVAAAIEGFWSAGPVPRVGKFAFGVVQMAIVAAWLTFGGRRRTETE